MKEFPVIKFTSALITGIVLQKLFVFGFSLLLFVTLILVVVTVLLRVILKNNNYLLLTAFILFVFTGSLTQLMSQNDKKHYPFKLQSVTSLKFSGIIKEIYLPTEKGTSFVLETDTLFCDKQNLPADFNLICFISSQKNNYKTFNPDKIKHGLRVHIEGNLSKPGIKRNPGDQDIKFYFDNRNLTGSFSVKTISLFHNKPDFLSECKNHIQKLRMEIYQASVKYLDRTNADLMQGLILADKRNLDPEISDEFVNAGVIHILAVSGSHVLFLLIIFNLLFKRTGYYTGKILTIAGLLFYLVFTLAPPPVLRAVLMGILYIIAKMTGRSTNLLNLLFLSAFLILLFSPNDLFDPGFQLSYSAVMAILIIYPALKNTFMPEVLHQKKKYFFEVFLVTVSATLGTLPFTIYYFHKLSLVGLLSNLIVIPLVFIIVAIAFLSMFVFFFSQFLFLVILNSLKFSGDILFGLVSFFNHFPAVYISVYSFTIFQCLFYLATLVVFIKSINKSRVYKGMLYFLIFISINFLLYRLVSPDLFRDNKILLIAPDVGQGDAFIILFPDGKTAMIDAGDDSGINERNKKTFNQIFEIFSVKKIDWAFISHMDKDHYKGYENLIKKGLVTNIYKPSGNTKDDSLFENICRSKSVKINHYKKTIIEAPDSRFYILDEVNTPGLKKNSNNNSRFIKFVFNKNSVLFTGDAENIYEDKIAGLYGDFIKSSVLKVSHHGSKKSTSDYFLTKCKPQRAIISVSKKNNFGHPAPEVISRLKAKKIIVDRTDLSGAVIYSLDGTNIKKIDWRNYY